MGLSTGSESDRPLQALPNPHPSTGSDSEGSGWSSTLMRWLFGVNDPDELLHGKGEQGPAIRFRNVCLSREAGAGGSTVGRLLADKLHWSCFDDNLVQTIANRMEIGLEEARGLDELAPSPMQRWILPLREETYAPLETYLDHLAEMLGSIAQRGQSVMVGRGAGFMLSRRETLSVRLVAPLKFRAARIAEQQGVSPRTGRRMARDLDKRRNRFVRTLYETSPTDDRNYDLVLNTSTLGIPTVVQILEDVVRLGMTGLDRSDPKSPSSTTHREATAKESPKAEIAIRPANEIIVDPIRPEGSTGSS